MLQTVEPLVFISERRGKSQKSGNEYQMIKFANPKTFENYELFADDVNVSGIFKGDLVNVEMSLNSGFGKTGISVVKVTS